MSAAPRFPEGLGYAGLHMTADEFFALGETQERYELIDGVVVMSPSPFPDHNEIIIEIGGQLRDFARISRGVRIFPDTDVRLSTGKVYRPDIAAYRAERFTGKVRRLTTPPDLVVEVLSAGSERLDLIKKREDYEQFGVGEYWVVHPETVKLRIWRRDGVRFVEAQVQGDSVPCESIPGFSLDLVPIRRIAEME